MATERQKDGCRAPSPAGGLCAGARHLDTTVLRVAEGCPVDGGVRQIGASSPCPLRFFTSKYYAEAGIVEYVRSHCVGDGLRARVSERVVTATKMYPNKGISAEMVHRARQQEIARTPEVLRGMARKFLHIQPHGTNEDRFAAALEHVLASAQGELDGHGVTR